MTMHVHYALNKSVRHEARQREKC